MYCSRQSNNLTNRVRERGLRLTYRNATNKEFQQIIRGKNEPTIHQKNLQVLMTEVYKIVNGIAPPIMNSLFNFCDSIHNIRNFQDRQVAISNLSAFFSEKGLTADFCRVESSRKESRKLPVPSRNFGLETCDIIITSSEPQKLIFLL